MDLSLSKYRSHDGGHIIQQQLLGLCLTHRAVFSQFSMLYYHLYKLCEKYITTYLEPEMHNVLAAYNVYSFQ